MAISITKATVGGNENSWGSLTNTALDTIVDAVNGTTGTVEPNLSALKINGTAVTSTAAELNILDGVTSTAAELNILDGVTSTTAELNILDGVTSTAAELNLLDGAVANTVVNDKAVIYGSAGEATITTANITTVDFGDWTITESGGSLYFATSGTNKMKLDASGNLDVVGNVNTNATIT